MENLLKDILNYLVEKDKIIDEAFRDRILTIIIKPNDIYKCTENRRLYFIHIKNEKSDTNDNATGQILMMLKIQHSKGPKSVSEPDNSLHPTFNKLATSESLHESDQSDKPSISLICIKKALETLLQRYSENAGKFTHDVPTCSTCASEPTYTEPTHSTSASEPTYSQPTRSASASEPIYPEPIYSTCANVPTYMEPTCSISASEPTYTEPTHSTSANGPTYSQLTRSASASEPIYPEPIYSTCANKPTYVELTCSISANVPTYTESTYSPSASAPTYTEFTNVANTSEWIYKPIHSTSVIKQISDTTIQQDSTTVEKITYTDFISPESAHTSTYTEHENFVSLDELLDNTSIIPVSDIITDTIYYDDLDDFDDFILPTISPAKKKK